MRTVVLPHLEHTPGYRGAVFLGRDGEEGRELLVVTFWESATAAGALGPAETAAYVPEEVQATLDAGDREVHLFELLERHGVELGGTD